jgi:hypothetical protein
MMFSLFFLQAEKKSWDEVPVHIDFQKQKCYS